MALFRPLHYIGLDVCGELRGRIRRNIECLGDETITDLWHLLRFQPFEPFVDA
jgi:hypothetical protein